MCKRAKRMLLFPVQRYCGRLAMSMKEGQGRNGKKDKGDKGGTERRTKGNRELLIGPTQRAGIFIAPSWFIALPGRALPMGGRPDVVPWR